jgi:hypothetical protein
VWIPSPPPSTVLRLCLMHLLFKSLHGHTIFQPCVTEAIVSLTRFRSGCLCVSLEPALPGWCCRVQWHPRRFVRTGHFKRYPEQNSHVGGSPTDTIRQNTETLIDANKEVGLEINLE